MSRASICGHREVPRAFCHRWSGVGDSQSCQGQGHSPAKHTRNELPSKPHPQTYKLCPSGAAGGKQAGKFCADALLFRLRSSTNCFFITLPCIPGRAIYCAGDEFCSLCSALYLPQKSLQLPHRC